MQFVSSGLFGINYSIIRVAFRVWSKVRGVIEEGQLKMPREVKVGPELQNRYVVSRLLGDGGFGIVWHATDKHERRDVAIKRMKNLGGGELNSLLTEARQIKTLRGHKNIVEMYETFVDEDEGFLVMEYVDGQSLQDIFQAHVRAGTWLDQEEALWITSSSSWMAYRSPTRTLFFTAILSLRISLCPRSALSSLLTSGWRRAWWPPQRVGRPYWLWR
jgi:hypothetical protein